MLTEMEILSLSPDTLEEQIRTHNRLYWDEQAPEIPDTLYDLMVERLRELRPNADILQDLGAQPVAESARVTHAHPMLSLDKCYTTTELERWFERFDGEAVVSPKIDGVAMALRYDEHGDLTLAATRGDGRQGERITKNARRVAGVPERLPFGPLEVRGEAYLPLHIFRERWAKEFSNPRNLAAGALKQKDPENTHRYGVHFMAYGVMGLEDIDTVGKRFDRLTEIGFHPVPYRISDKAHGQEVFDAFSKQRADLDYEIDGVVYMVNDATQHAKMGHTAHHPRYAMAYKFQGESGTSTLRALEWNVSRTGKINPIAIIEPISLSGVTVQRVSLHNLGIIEQLADGGELMLGSGVLVTRRGGVIPHIEAVTTVGDIPIEVPERCPSCGAPTARKADFLVADHAQDCVTSALKRLEHFASVTDIQGVGPRLLAQLFEADRVHEPGDLYLLTQSELCELERIGEKSAQNVLDAIDARRQLRASTFLASLGIEELGMQIALALEEEFREDWNGLLAADIARLTAVEGVGKVIAQHICEGVEQLSGVIERLLLHVTLTWPEQDALAASDGILSGLGIVFTGAMARMKRKDAQALVRELGGNTPSGVSGAVRYLVIGDGDYDEYAAGRLSSKAKKAKALQDKGTAIEIISESAFLDLIDA